MAFKLVEKKYLKNIDTTAHMYEHKKTKARLLFFENNDINKSFSISFKTIPYNDNGIFHILEHSVLCGSEKYPVKEPFVELIKGSFNTFINAMTFSDKTMYPVSSKNDEDLKILMDIYLDSVFNPKILKNENILKQEGWHYHLESKEDKLIYKGVVYNEMKGAYSSIDEIIDMHIAESLFKNTEYAYSSGGKPSAIPTLTQKEFVETYNFCYHPSNSYIFLYGNLELDSYLKHIDKYLSKYDKKDYSNYILTEQNLEQPVIHNVTYFNEEIDNKHYVAINYIVGKITDINSLNSIDIIDEILLGNSNTEFRKYFIDNNICEDVYSYVQKDRLQIAYSIIYKNVSNKYIDEISKLHEEHLYKVINNKFDCEQIQATINKNSFIIKEEVNKASSPKGVSYAIRALRTWLHNEDPLAMFYYDELLEQLQYNLDNNKYEELATKYLLNNNQKSIVILKATDKKIDEENLDDYYNSLNEEEINNIINDTNKLIIWQNSKDKKEDLDKIKCVDAKKVIIKKQYDNTNFEQIDDIIYAHYDTQTNGIVYSSLMFDITNFDITEIQYASLLLYLLFNINTKNKSELEITKEIDFNLGNITANVNIYKKDTTNDINLKFNITSKNLVEKTDKLVEIIIENTLNNDFSNKQTIYNIILELKLNLENRFKNSGHSFVNRRVMSYNSLQHKISEYISGYDFYEFVKELVENFDIRYIELQKSLENIVKNIFNSNNLLISVTGTNEIYSKYKEHILNYVNKLNSDAILVPTTVIKFTPKEKKYSEAFYFDTLVQYVGYGFNIDKYNGHLIVLRHILNFDYLWNSIRVKGGAYGAGITINKYGEIGFWSYRDPNLTKTVETYRGVANYIRELNIDDVTLNKYIIGALNSFDQLMSPKEKSTISLTSELTESDKGLFDKLVNEIKNITLEDLINLAELFDNSENNSYKCVIGSKEIINDHKKLFNKIIELN